MQEKWTCKLDDGTILTEKHEWLITKENGVELNTHVHKNTCINGRCKYCYHEIEEKMVEESREDPLTIIDTTMSNEELEQFEKCRL